MSTTPAEMILLDGRADLPAGRGHVPALGQQHRERRVPAWARRAPSTTWWPGAGSRPPDFDGPVDVRHPEPARGLPEDPPRAPALARAGVGARHAAGGGGRAARAGAPDRARQQEGAEGARGQVPGRAEVREGREDQGRARRQHRQEHHQGRRPVLHVLRGRLVHGQEPDRPLGGDEQGAGRDLRDPDQLARPQRHLRDRRGRRRRVGHLRDRGDVHGRDGRVGLRGLGQRLVLPAVLRRVLRRLSVLLRPLPDLRLRRLATTPGPAPTAAARWPTARTAAPASARATTPRPAPTRAAPRPTDPTARAPRARPTTRAPAPTARRARARTSTGAGAARRCSAATSGRRRRG